MTAVALALVAGTVACEDDEDPTADSAQFCGEVDANVKTLTKPKLETGEDVAAYVALYQRLGELVPLAVEDDWTALTELYETASTVDPSNRESLNKLNEQAFRTERSAVEVKRWLKQNCRVNLPVTTIVDHDVKVPVSSVPATTLPG